MNSGVLENIDIAKVYYRVKENDDIYDCVTGYLHLSFEAVYDNNRMVSFINYIVQSFSEINGLLCVQNKPPHENVIDSRVLADCGFQKADENPYMVIYVYKLKNEAPDPKFKTKE